MHFWYAMHRHLWGCFIVCWNDYYCAMHLWCIVPWYWVQYFFGVASLVLCIVSYIALACYRSGASALSQTMTHWFLVFPILTFSIGFFSFFRFCDAPCEKEETAFICASDGSLYRFLLFTKIFKTFLAKIKIRNKCEMLRAHCGRHVYQVGGIFFLLIVAAPPWTSVACVRWCWWSAVFAWIDFYSTYLVSASLLRSRGFRELNRIRPVSSSLVF